jgi:signal transduction histidine kinase
MMKSDPSLENSKAALTPGRRAKAYLFEAVEAVLLLGDYQQRAGQRHSIADFCKMALGGIGRIATFDQAAILTFDAGSSDLSLVAAAPPGAAAALEGQVDGLIELGTVAWAIRERRGITVPSSDGEKRCYLHVIATYARIRGLFIGVQTNRSHIPDGARELLSLFMRSLATSLESIEYTELLEAQNQQLQQQVDEKMHLLLRQERELANTRKLNAVASLAGGIAHEYNNALMSLLGYMELSNLACLPDSKISGYLEKMTPVVERMSLLTNQLLAYSQGGKYKKEVVDLPDLIDQVLATTKSGSPADVRVETDDKAGALIVEGDLNQLHQALSALVTNARESFGVNAATAAGGALAKSGEIRIRVRRIDFDQIPPECAERLIRGNYILVEVADTGCGMDKETRERMFEPFYSTKFAGRGLSLAAVLGIVENHKGAIRVESQLGRGSRMQLYLPVRQEAAADGPASEQR